ncbi:hypothetical protein ACV17F_004748 [Vibrio harveyi]
MYSDVIAKITEIASSSYLRPNPSLIATNYTVQSDGTYRSTITGSAFCSVSNNVNIYDNSTINFVKSIKIITKGIDYDIKLKVQTGNGESKVRHAKSRETIGKNDEYIFDIFDIPIGIFVSCPEGKSYGITGLKIEGNDVSNIVSLVSSTQKLYANLKDKEGEIISSLNDEVTNLEEHKRALSEDIANLLETNKRLHETTNVEETQLKQTRSHVESSRNELKEINEELERNRELSKETIKQIKEDERKIAHNKKIIGDKEVELEDIQGKLKVFKEDESLFSEDFSSFKEEIRNQNKIYYILLTVFIGLATFVAFNIYNNALSTVDNYQFNFDLWTLFVSRLPLIFINIFILGAFSSVIYLIINLLTSNFNNIAKTQQVTYLVKDCVEAQSNNLNTLKEDQILKQRVESKMALIQKLIETSYEKKEPKIEESTVKSIVTDLLKKQDKGKSS